MQETYKDMARYESVLELYTEMGFLDIENNSDSMIARSCMRATEMHNNDTQPKGSAYCHFQPIESPELIYKALRTEEAEMMDLCIQYGSKSEKLYNRAPSTIVIDGNVGIEPNIGLHLELMGHNFEAVIRRHDKIHGFDLNKASNDAVEEIIAIWKRNKKA